MGLILVVSEDLVEIETIRAALSVHGWWVTVAADRQAALQVAADQAPKLVMVDNDLSGSLDLLRSFGTDNGGPGVVALVPPDFEGALDLKEAGVDEMLTKPLSPPTVLEGVQRCLTTPRPSPLEQRAPSSHLLTTEEIFGEVLRELGESDAPPTPAEEAPAAGVTTQPLPAPRPETPIEPDSATEPAMSLDGLFEAPAPSPPAAFATAPAPPAQPAWQGEERRGAGRPWNTSPARAAAPATAAPPEPTSAEDEADTVVCDDADTVACDDAGSDVETVVADGADTVAQSDAAPVLQEILASALEVAPESAGSGIEEELEPDETVPEAAAEDDATPRRRVRPAIAVGTLAAALLVAAGVYYVVAAGPERSEGPARPAERVETTAAPSPQPAPDPAPPAQAETMTNPAAVAPAAAEIVPAAAPPLAEPTAELPEVDLGAIVDQELERREEELRRVFLEEEKRLLRELNELDPDETPGGSGGEDDAAEREGVGR